MSTDMSTDLFLLMSSRVMSYCEGKQAHKPNKVFIRNCLGSFSENTSNFQ